MTAPIAQTYPYEVICPIDGWYWDNNIQDGYLDTTTSGIKWTVYPKNDQYASEQINPYVNRIYFNCYLYKCDALNLSEVPVLSLVLNGTTFTGSIDFKCTPQPTTPGLYTFVADIGSSTSSFGTIYNNGGMIKPLTFLSSSPTGQTLAGVNVTAESISQIAIKTGIGANYKFILSNIYMETNNGTNAFGGATNTVSAYTGAGVSNYVFSSTTVKDLYYERALTYLYANFYKTPIATKVTPLFNSPNPISTNPPIYDVVPTPTM